MSNQTRIDCLDGLRGVAALWVLVGHAHILSGWRVPLFDNPDLGVDLFIMLSGFLMVFHYQRRQDVEPWLAPATWVTFWTRRFFRIAPLYYFLLAVALALGPYIYESRMLIDATNGVTPQRPERYLDDGLTNIAMHISFLFGFSPAYAFRTALPDWSIGLEMQFYMAFPFIMILVLRSGWIVSMSVLAVSSVAVAALMQFSGIAFPMPTFLPLKLSIFAAGMLIAAALNAPPPERWTYLILAAVLATVPLDSSAFHLVARLLIAAGFFILVHHDLLPNPLARTVKTVSKALGSRMAHHLGELSYGVYLIHLIVMQPVVAWLLSSTEMNPMARFFSTLAITIPTVYALAWVTYRIFERPGQAVGRHVVRTFLMTGNRRAEA